VRLASAFHETLLQVSEAARSFESPWWIIGSAAARLVGAEISDMRDIDLLADENDVRRLLAVWPGEAAVDVRPDPQFRSRIFRRFEFMPAPVEAFGGFEMCVDGDWRTVRPKTRLAVAGVFVPDALEQIELLTLMARPKDAPRVAALRRVLAAEPVAGGPLIR